MTDREAPVATPVAQRLEDFRRRTAPVLVWSVAVVICAVLLFQRVARHEFIGLAHTQEYSVSARAPGTLAAVLVDVYDSIEAGEVVARLDETQLVASLETARANVRQLGAELEAARAQTRTDSAQLTGELRRFQIDEEQRRLDSLELRVVIEEDEIELERLKLEVERNRELVEEGFVGRQEFDEIRLLADQVAERITLNRELLEQFEEEYRVAQGRRQRYEADLPGAADRARVLQPLSESIHVADRMLQELELQRQALVLRSPVSGQVSQLLGRRGQTVAPGEPILMVAERSPREIVAYLNEADSEAARVNTRVLISRRQGPARTAESLVLRVSPTIQPLPMRLWADSRRPDHGRAVVIAGVPALELVPGELVNIRLIGD